MIPAAAAPLSAVTSMVRAGIGMVKGGDKALDTFDKGHRILQQGQDRTMLGENRSLTQKLRQSFITSRVFIDGAIFNDEIVGDIIKTAEVIYIGLLTNAVGMDQYVDGMHTVSNHLSRIQTHEFESLNTPMDGFSDTVTALENLNEGLLNALGDIVGVSTEDTNKRKNAFTDEADEERAEREHADRLDRATHNIESGTRNIEARERARKVEAASTNGRDNHINVDAVDTTVKSGPLPPMGRFVKLKLRNPQNGIEIDMPIIVQLYPFVINPITMGHILSGYGVSADRGHQWLRFRAGELTFWKDLVFQSHRARAMAKDLKNDRTGQLKEYLNHIHKKDKFRFLENIARLGMGKSYRPSSNLLNSIIVATEESVMRAKADGSGDFDNFKIRQRFFDSSYAMLLFVVDPNHERIKMYINGLQPAGHYRFSDFKDKKSGESKELLKIVASMAAGRSAQF